jgi:hypothetical protein
MTLLCVICLRGSGVQEDAVTVVGGNAVCRKHLTAVRVDDDTLRAIQRDYEENR